MENEDSRLRPPARQIPSGTPSHKRYAVVGVLLIALAAAVGAWWWQRGSKPASAPQTSTAPTQPAASAAPPASAAVAAAPVISHPIEAAASSAEPAAAPLDMPATLAALFGRDAVLKLLQTEDFARRVVATVDNLGRARAPSRLWPVNPTGGRFTVIKRGDLESISPDNGLRYSAFVQLVEAANLRQVAAAYVRLYPSFQTAYEELGYPKGYFNDRLVEVIDQLLATPQVDGPIAVHLTEVKGPYQPARPWVMYEFDDPALQRLTAGQKLLLRMGPVNTRRMKTRLAAFRELVVRSAAPR